MKTKKFLLATAGATVDGRTIDANMLAEMAEGYEPKTYGARLNIEHIRGLGTEGPFRAYGDVLELSVEDVEVKLHGQTETRKGLFGVFDISDDAKALNDAGQKVYPSIEIEPNFAGTGKAYLMGVALTDSPASVATERLAFNRKLPGALTVGADDASQAFAIEFAEDDGKPSDSGSSFLTQLGGMFDAFAAKIAGDKPKPETPPAGAQGDDAGADNFSQLRPLFEDMGKQFAQQITDLQTAQADQADRFAVQIKALETKIDAEPATTYTSRPAATGANGDRVKTDC